MGKEEYIETLVSQMRCKRAREAVARELENHIEEAAETYEAFGLAREEAYERAVRQMGDPVKTGVEMDRIHRPRLQWQMLGLILLLSILGILVQYHLELETQANVFQKQCIAVVLGLGIMLAVYVLDYSFLGKYTYAVYWGYVALIFAVQIFGKIESYRFWVNGMQRFLIMPMYLFVPLFAAVLYRHRGGGRMGLLRCISFGALPVLLAMKLVPSVMCGLDLAVIFGIMILIAVISGWFAVNKKRTAAILAACFFVIPAGLFTLGMQFFFQGYQRARILAFLMPRQYGEYASYPKTAAREMLRQSKVLGEGGKSMLLFDNRLTHSEYIFTQMIAKFGILAGICALVLLACLIVQVFHISVRQQNQLGRMIGIGCGLVFLVQVMGIVFMNLGIGMEATLFLPFFSYGNSAAIVFYILLGLVLSIYRYKDIPAGAGMRRRTFS
ncbi:MAG: FtsW/RodA/SpoVE family cell cycle protein [Lachnospiraceae bacterium]|jgi:cell division protein FtsW (lipid II flippase)|nr:FtsW/RodA/SpoVE family cell cycle protein [Lachnospiraceae bacterium]